MSKPIGRDDKKRRHPAPPPTTTTTGRKKLRTAGPTCADGAVEQASRDEASESAAGKVSQTPSSSTDAPQDDARRRSVGGGDGSSDGQDENEDESQGGGAAAVAGVAAAAAAAENENGDKEEEEEESEKTTEVGDADASTAAAIVTEPRGKEKRKATPEQREKAAARRAARAKKKAKPHVRKKPQRPVTRDEIEPDVADRQPLGCYVLFDSRFLADPRIGGTRNFARHMRSPELVRELRRAASHAREAANERSRAVQHKLVRESAVGGGGALAHDDARPLVFVANGFVCERDLDQFRWRLAHEYSPHKRTKDAFGGVRERNRRARAVQSLPHPAQTEVPSLRLARMLQAIASVLQVDQWTQDSLSMRSELRRETPELVFYWFGPDPEVYGYNFKLLTAAYPVRHIFNCAVDTFRSTFKATLGQPASSPSSSSSTSSSALPSSCASTSSTPSLPTPAPSPPNA